MPTDDRIDELVRVFLAENAKVNLTALREPEACRIGNVLDSLAFLELIARIGTPKTVLDLGTGGGFPLLPMAMALPETKHTGMDSTGKKLDAVARITKAMDITNVRLLKARAEDAGRNRELREAFDVVTARALASMATLAELVSPFVRVGGHAVLWKSMHAGEEIAAAAKALHECRLEIQKAHVYTLPGDFGQRQLLVLRKTAPLPAKYPRENGMPGKMPIA